MSGISIRLSRRVPWSQDVSRKTLRVLLCGPRIQHARLTGMETRGREWLLVGAPAGLALFRHDPLTTGQNQTFIRADLTRERRGTDGGRPPGRMPPASLHAKSSLTIWTTRQRAANPVALEERAVNRLWPPGGAGGRSHSEQCCVLAQELGGSAWQKPLRQTGNRFCVWPGCIAALLR